MDRSRPTGTAHPRLLWVFSLLLVVALAGFAGCSSDTPSGGGDTTATSAGESTTSTTPDDSSTDSDLPESLELTAEDDGDSFSVKEGGTISVALEANPSTGFMWELELEDPEASLLEQLREPSFVSDDPEAAGAGGIMTYTFRAVDPGEMVVRMVYLPPDGSEPTDAFEIDLTVE